MIGYLATRLLPMVPRSVVYAIARRYVAGEDLDAAVNTVGNLNRNRFDATLDILGEDATDAAHADATVRAYCEVLERVAAEGLRSNISVKLTHLGMRLDPEAALGRVESLVARAGELGNFVRIDMEDSSLTDATLGIHRTLRERHANVGTVLQAYLRRTEVDARELASVGTNLRLCKGIYREPATIAFKDRDEIRESFLRTANVLLEGKATYTGFATHDRELIAGLVAMVNRMEIPRDRFEFQALLGVPVEDLLRKLVDDGFRVRIYVPFGSEWYPYSSRRLKENPKMASYVISHLFSPRSRASRDEG
jgi:proline dehydrogenase